MLFSVVLSALLVASQARHFPFGPQNDLPVPFIIGGDDVDYPGKWPFMVSLWQNTPFGGHFCGASLVSTNWLVTASHCMDGQYPGGIVALVGGHDFDNANVGAPVFYTARNIIMHESYNPRTLDNDIALIQLADNVQLNQYVQIIDMAEPSDGDFAGAQCHIIGWGADEIGGQSTPSVLQEVQVPAASKQECTRSWAGQVQINDGHICVGIPNQAGGCYGDSGGPLVCPDASGSYVLAGATSFGPPYCPPIQPTVYARVSYYREWIRRNSGL